MLSVGEERINNPMNDEQLIWEAYIKEISSEFNGEPEGFARIKNQWENDILPILDLNRVDELDYTTNEDGLVIFFPIIHLIHEKNIDLDNSTNNQVERLKQEFQKTFGKYNFIEFEVSHQTDSAVEDAELTNEGQWLAINVYINEIEVKEDDVDDYFKIILAVNAKAKELSRS